MSTTLVFLHTVSSLVKPFNDLSREILPADVEILHIADEILLKIVLAQGGLSPFIYRRVAEHVVAAEQAGAEGVLLTCSSIAPCVDAARLMVNIPVLRVDEPMVEKAISMGTRIGVAATAAKALPLYGALRGGYLNSLVTDEGAARRLLTLFGHGFRDPSQLSLPR